MVRPNRGVGPQRLAGGVLGKEFDVAGREAGRLLDDGAEVDVGRCRPAGEVNLQNLRSRRRVRRGDLNTLVEPARAADRVVHVLDEVRRAQHHHVLVGDPFEFGEQLVDQLLLAAVHVAVAVACAGDAVDFVDEEDTGGVRAGDLEQFLDFLCGFAHVLAGHVGGRDLDEGVVDLARECACDVCLPTAGRAMQQDAVDDADAVLFEGAGSCNGRTTLWLSVSSSSDIPPTSAKLRDGFGSTSPSACISTPSGWTTVPSSEGRSRFIEGGPSVLSEPESPPIPAVPDSSDWSIRSRMFRSRRSGLTS